MIGFERSFAAYPILDAYVKIYPFWVSDDIGNGKAVRKPSGGINPKFNELVFDVFDKGQDPNVIYCVGPYIYGTGLKRVKESAFAMHSRTFEHNGLDYGNNMEYQTIECCLLSVPIIHRHFAETCTNSCYWHKYSRHRSVC